PWRQPFHRRTLVRCDRTFAIDWLRQSIYDTANERLANGNVHDAPGAFHLIAFTNFCVLAQQHHADLSFFQIQRKTHDSMREREKFARHRFFEAIHAGDAITDGMTLPISLISTPARYSSISSRMIFVISSAL